jgi:hypothetical protein
LAGVLIIASMVKSGLDIEFGVVPKNLFKIKIMSPAEVAQWQNSQLIIPRLRICLVVVLALESGTIKHFRAVIVVGL